MWCLTIKKLAHFRCLKAPPVAHGYAQAAHRNFLCLWLAKGLTQEKVKTPSGFSQKYLSSLQQGRRNTTAHHPLRKAQKCPEAASLGRTSFSNVRSDTARRSRVFSASSSFRRFT
jgi:hypothetical protein